MRKNINVGRGLSPIFHSFVFILSLPALMLFSGCLQGQLSGRMFIVKSEITASNPIRNWKVRVWTDQDNPFALKDSMLCTAYIEYPLYFRHGLCVCARLDGHGPYDMTRFGLIKYDAVRSHNAYIGRYLDCKGNIDMKVCIMLAEEDFPSVEALQKYMEELCRVTNRHHIAFSDDGVLCRIVPRIDYGAFDVDIAKITIKGLPLTKEIITQLNTWAN